MGEPVTINPRIIEALYCEALLLSDDVRGAFTLTGRIESCSSGETRERDELARVALSSEGLRTTTRMMHAVAWLLNHRAFFSGELSEFQLMRHGRLSRDMRRSDPSEFELLPADIRTLVIATERFYERLLRLDRDWRQRDTAAPGAIAALRARLERRVVGGR